MSQSVPPQPPEPRKSIDPVKPPVLIAPKPPERPEEKPQKVVSPGTVLTALSYLSALLPWVKRQPRWVKILIGIPFIVVATFYFRDQRIGNGIFAGKPAWTADLGGGVTAYPLKSGEVRVVYNDGTEYPPDGYGVITVTADDEAGKKTLEATGQVFAPESFPLIVFFNTSGFDESGLPTAVRRASDGKTLWQYQDNGYGVIRLLVPQKDGNFKVYNGSSEYTLTPAELAARVTRTPPEPVHAPAEFEKLTDDELKEKGFERITAEEYEKRFGRKPPLVRPLTVPPAEDKK